MASGAKQREARRRSLGSWLAPARFILFVVLLAAGTAAGILIFHDVRHAIMGGFDIAAIAFLISCAPLFNDNQQEIISHAAENDANRVMLLVITGIVVAVILVVVASEASGQTEGPIKGLILGTLALAWLFTNTVFAFHYAHLCYREGGSRQKGNGGIDFPKTTDPNYWDFLYFSFTLGMTFQTSDTDITETGIRRTAVSHSFGSFMFSIGVIAFTISVIGGH